LFGKWSISNLIAKTNLTNEVGSMSNTTDPQDF